MHETHQHLDQETLAAYAVDALAPAEVTRIGAHLAACARCQQELASLRAVAGMLPLGLPPADPPSDMRARILARARATRPGAAVVPPAPAPDQTRTRSRWWPRLAPALAALTLIMGFLLGQRWPLPQTPDLVNQPGARAVSLAGQGAGTLVLAPDQGRVRLTVSRMPALAADQVYQVWLLGADAPVSAGLFTVDSSGSGRLEISGMAWSPTYSGIAITREPAGGSAGPTGDILVQGSL